MGFLIIDVDLIANKVVPYIYINILKQLLKVPRCLIRTRSILA